MFRLRSREECKFDAVSLGEVLLRLDPGDCRIRVARTFRAWEGGGEYNVARSLRRCFEQRTAIVTALADNEIGRLVEDLILQGGVDTSLIHWKESDGVGATCRNAINFAERGFGVRPASVTFDRANTATTQLKPSDVDWERLFGVDGVRWLHTGGIFAHLSAGCAEVAEAAMTTARKHGTVVSYDMNYRASLWHDAKDHRRKLEVTRRLAKQVDVLFAGRRDLAILARDAPYIGGEHISEGRLLEPLVDAIRADYPNLSLVATPVRRVHSATMNDWTGVAWHGGRLVCGPEFRQLLVYDRIGGGDSFAAGVIYGLLSGHQIAQALAYGVAHGALTMTTPGDTSMAALQDVERLLAGEVVSVRR